MKDGAAATEMARNFKGSAPIEPTAIIIESPYGTDDANQLGLNIELVANACRTAMMAGFNPFASHLFYPIFLDEESKEERALGIRSGFQWGQLAREVWFILRTEENMTPGMLHAFSHYISQGKLIRYFRTADNGLSFTEVTKFQEDRSIVSRFPFGEETPISRPNSEGAETPTE